MGRPATVDPMDVVAFVRAGNLAAEAARQFNISRVRVRQILLDKAPDLIPNKPRNVPRDEARAMKRRQKNLMKETLDALTSTQTKVEAAAKLDLTVSGLNSRIARLGIEHKVALEDRTADLKERTRKALKAAPSKAQAARDLGISPSGLNSRIERFGLVDPFNPLLAANG
ncbi:hypothetical protein KIKIMORA_02150 [Brevundimonas phage vB_BpoS-Kikimora]|uniref:Uncharacterized protein n=2 Tax=Kikimoravirus TaxID=3425051 RepID=A0A9E7STE3_9CAUD|nr:hypothetical protein KIKIMORA_02150 [Brevundimonas phage vB_BpoS-Kikimora]UTC28252.1 hypothetical protein GURKE_02210 [Brevundimonas phage vB_BpoS-Gurke]